MLLLTDDVDLKGNECTNRLKPGEGLKQGDKLCSKNGQFVARLQAGDGNFVVYRLVRYSYYIYFVRIKYGIILDVVSSIYMKIAITFTTCASFCYRIVYTSLCSYQNVFVLFFVIFNWQNTRNMTLN